MSSNFPPPPQGDQYLYTSQDSLNHDIPGFDGSVLSYQASQPPGLPDDIGRSTQNAQFTNTYAFNTNRNSNYRDRGEPRLEPSQISFLSSVQPQMPLQVPESLPASQALPGLPNAASAQTNGLKPQATHDNLTAAVESNGVGTRIVEQVGSDLEEGELSEGTDHASPNIPIPTGPASNNQSSMKVNGAFVRETPGDRRKEFPRMAPRSEKTAQGNTIGHRSPASGADSIENRQRNHGGMRAKRQAVNGRAKMDWAGRDRTPPTQRHRIKSLKASQEGARHAVKQLRPHHIGYLQLSKEHIDAELLKKIYAELQIAIPESSNTRVSPINTEAQKASISALAETRSDTNFISSVSGQHTDTPDTTIDPGSQHAAKSQDWPQKNSQGRREADAAAEGINQISYNTGKNQSGYEKGSSIIPDKAVTAKSTPMRIDTNANSQSIATVSADKVTKPLPAITGDKSAAVLSIPQRPTQPPAPATATASKSPASKTAPKPVDRKDYIARLLAAKAGKALPTISASKPSPDPVPHKVPQAPSDTKDEKSKIDEAGLDQGSSKSNLKKIEEPSEVAMSSAGQKSAAAKAKKREQTELARRKIEELKKRSEALKNAPPSANEAPAGSDGQQSPLVPKPTTAPSERVTLQLTRPPTLHNTSQHSYFPLHNPTFTIPGLFMSSQQTQPDMQKQPLTAAPVLEQTLQADLPATTTSIDSNADVVPQQSVLAMKTPTSPNEDHKVTENGPIAQTMISGNVSNPRKRPTAADSLELVPSKSRRLGVSKHDSSVVFEVSDDEADEYDHDTSEMQFNGDQEAVSKQVGGLQISRSRSTEQTNPSQHSALTGSPGNSEPNKGTATLPVQSLLAPPKLKESGGLRSKEEEIARMNRKIAEMEQRRKSKQVASRAQTPGTPGNTISSIKLADDNGDVATMCSGIRRLSEPTSRMEEGNRMLEDVQRPDSTLQQDSLTKQRMQSMERTEGTTNSAAIVIEEQQRRKAEIESSIPSMNATVEEYMARLLRLQQEEADLRAQIQKQIDDKRTLQSELDNMLQPSASVAESSATTSAKMPEPELVVGSQAPVSSVPPSVSSNKEQHLADLPSNGVHENLYNGALLDISKTPVQPSAPGTPQSFQAPTDRSLENGELAEDVMDISGSEGDGVLAKDRPGSGANRSPPVENSDGEEIYEPPASFEMFENDPVIPADCEQPRLHDEESLHQEPQKFQPLSPSAESSIRSDVQAIVEDEVSAAQLPDGSDHASPIVDMSDSDDYEPPEPTTSVDVPSLTHDEPASTSESSFSPPDANQVIKIEPASPEPLITENDQAAAEVAEMARNDPEKASINLRLVLCRRL
ncbi:MAG: hypothetical protein LQ343_004901 [Gyalolechia ehrenbergii]|nr:MAG: hypothetical protein LQ343_004901 [Gyalolechia ehrenbergii]